MGLISYNPVVVTRLAESVSTMYQTKITAFTEDRKAEARTLADVIATVKSALPAVCNAMLIGSKTWHSVVGGPTTLDAHGAKALYLAGDVGPVKLPKGPALQGTFEGDALWIRHDGVLLDVDYEGTWSASVSEGIRWTAGVREITPEQAIENGDQIEACLTSLGDAFQRFLAGSSRKRTEQARQHADMLRAISTLLAVPR